MVTLRDLLGLGTIALLATAGLACPPGDDDDDDSVADDDDSVADDDDSTAATSPGTALFFGSSGEGNVWEVTVLDPSADPMLVAQVEIDDLSTLSGPAASGGNDAGATWGDATTSTDGGRVFVNARSVNKVAVFDVASRSLETLLDVGERPVHSYNPNHGDEIWTHADGPGAFYVIDQQTLAVSAPLVAALDDAGHGKLLYAEELGTQYYATNTNDPGAFPVNGAAMTVGDIISVCAAPCEDDLGTPEDESLDTCASTHDKVYNPTMDWALFQCSGDTRGSYGIVDASNDTIVEALHPVSGSVAHSPGNEYILLLSGDQVQIWDTGAATHNGLDFDSVLTVAGAPSARGTHFWENDAGNWEAWVPQTEGDFVTVIDLSDFTTEDIEIGTLTEPPGASHFSRRSGIGGDWFWSYNDAGIVMVDLRTREMTQGPATSTLTSRIAWAPAE